MYMCIQCLGHLDETEQVDSQHIYSYNLSSVCQPQCYYEQCYICTMQHAISYHVVSHHIICHMTSCVMMSCHVMSHHVMPCHVVCPCCIIGMPVYGVLHACVWCLTCLCMVSCMPVYGVHVCVSFSVSAIWVKKPEVDSHLIYTYTTYPVSTKHSPTMNNAMCRHPNDTPWCHAMLHHARSYVIPCHIMSHHVM